MQALAFSTHLLRRNKPMQTMNISTSNNPGESVLKTSGRRLPLMLWVPSSNSQINKQTLNKRSGLRCACGLTFMRGGRTMPFCIRRPYQKNPKTIRLQGIQHHTLLKWSSTATDILKRRGKFCFVFCHPYRRKTHLLCTLYVSVVHQVLAHTGMKYSDKINKNNMYLLLQMHSFASRPQVS